MDNLITLSSDEHELLAEYSHLREKKPKPITKPITIRMTRESKQLISILSKLESISEGELIYKLIKNYASESYPDLITILEKTN